jgi:hypothetical protein
MAASSGNHAVSAAAAVQYDCDHCADKRRVYNAFTGSKIRCPMCTTPTLTKQQKRRNMQEFVARDRERAAEREQHSVNTEDVRKITGIDVARSMLYQWGRFVRERGNGFPPMSAHEKARIGRGGGGNTVTPFPIDLQIIERAVNDAIPSYKAILVEHYTKNGYCSQKAARLGIGRTTYFQRKDKAESYIATAIGV